MPKPVVDRALAMPARLRALATLAIAGAAVLAATPARAATDWLCSLSDDGVRLVCVADDDPRVEAAAEAPPARPTAVVRGTRFPLDRRQVYTVDLFSPPDDEAWVGLLARSTICHRSPGCSVTLAPSAWLTARAPRHRLDTPVVAGR